MIRALIGMLAVRLSCSFAVASEPRTKPKGASEPAVSAKRQAKLDAIHAKRKAASLRKHNAVANQHGSLTSLESSIRHTDVKMIPKHAAAAINKQSAAVDAQLLQQQPILTAEQALWNQEREILLMELSRQGLLYGPNGVIVPGVGLPALQIPSLGGLQIPSIPSLDGLQQIPSLGGLQIPSLGGLPVLRH
jgi:hypothetical protein